MAMKIPYSYQEVEYIEATAAPYIDLGIVPSNHCTEIKFDGGDYNNAESLLGNFASNNSANYYHFTFFSNKYYWGRNGSEGSGGNWTAGIHTLKYNYGSNYQVILDDVVLGSGSNISSSKSLVLFAREGSTKFSGRVYWCKVTDKATGKIVRDLVPCYRKSDGVAGLYDLANSTFFMNNGTGEFEVGPEINVVHRTFQPGIVGKTNVVEGAVIPDIYEQLVNYDMLYYYGDECNDLTGGWVTTYYNSKTGASWEKRETALYAKCSTKGSYTANWRTTNKIALTPYSAVFAISKLISGTSTNHKVGGTMYPRVALTTNTTGLAESANDPITITKRIVDKISVKYTSFTNSNSLYAATYQNANETTFEYELHAFCLLKPDDYNALCDLAGVSTFATVDELVADTTAISAILSNQSAVRFMVKKCTGDFMASFVASSACLSLLESSPYKEKVYANPHWAKFLAMVA